MSRPLEVASPIRVGIIGGGYGISTLLPAISTLKEFQVYSLARSGNSGRKLERSGSAFQSLSIMSANEIIRDTTIDLVVIACPPVVQEKYAIEALKSGKSIFCEKPGGLNVEATRRIISVVNQTKGYATIGYQFRYDPLINWLTKRVTNGSIGKVRKIDIQWETSGAAKTPVTSWRNNLEAGGGVLRDFASHIFDYLSVIDQSDFKLIDTNYVSIGRNIRSNIQRNDIQEIDFSAQYGEVQLNCKVSRKANNPLGHQIAIEGERGNIRILHKTPFGVKDMSARFWSNAESTGVDCAEELGLGKIAKDLERYGLDLRQLAVRRLFLEFALIFNVGAVSNLPGFGQALSNQLYVEEVQNALYRK